VRVNLTPGDRERIVVGQPLPFSIFSAEGSLLLAAGRVVESGRARDVLLNNGSCRDPDKKTWATNVADDDSTERLRISPLIAFQSDYRRSNPARGFPMSMARNDTSEAFRTFVAGVHGQILIVDAPRRSDGALVAVMPRQAWLCRTFQATSAFRFLGTVLKVAFEPFPHVYLEVPKNVEQRKIRNKTRATVLLSAVIETPASTQCVVVDLSVGGGRIATSEDVVLDRDQPIRIELVLETMGSQYHLSLGATVARNFGASNPEHPRVAFYGIRFDSLSELDACVLNGFVNSELALELNSLWQVLSLASPGARD
jgi:Flagellar protein YcgR/PilZ domain